MTVDPDKTPEKLRRPGTKIGHGTQTDTDRKRVHMCLRKAQNGACAPVCMCSMHVFWLACACECAPACMCASLRARACACVLIIAAFLIVPEYRRYIGHRAELFLPGPSPCTMAVDTHFSDESGANGIRHAEITSRLQTHELEPNPQEAHNTCTEHHWRLHTEEHGGGMPWARGVGGMMVAKWVSPVLCEMETGTQKSRQRTVFEDSKAGAGMRDQQSGVLFAEVAAAPRKECEANGADAGLAPPLSTEETRGSARQQALALAVTSR